MSDIKTITETVASGSYDVENRMIENNETDESKTIRLLRDKIDELVAEVNTIKSALSGD